MFFHLVAITEIDLNFSFSLHPLPAAPWCCLSQHHLSVSFLLLLLTPRITISEKWNLGVLEVPNTFLILLFLGRSNSEGSKGDPVFGALGLVESKCGHSYDFWNERDEDSFEMSQDRVEVAFKIVLHK